MILAFERRRPVSGEAVASAIILRLVWARTLMQKTAFVNRDAHRSGGTDAMARKRKTTLLDVWMDGIATATTLSVRLPQLMTGTMSPAETRRMVAEKIAAAQFGWAKAASAATRVALGKPSRQPTVTAARSLSVLDAAVGPARRTVRANAKRLTTSRPR